MRVVSQKSLHRTESIGNVDATDNLSRTITHSLGDFVLANPSAHEVDINPAIAYPRGREAVVLEALIVTE